MTKTAKLLSELIALPSVNPAFLPMGDKHAGEHRVASYLAASGRRGGLDIEFQPVLPNRANLLVRCSPSGRIHKRVILAPHMDTVGGNDAHLFRPRIVKDRLYGRGACDTKGSVAAMFAALVELATGASRPAHTEITFVGLVDEESTQAGSRVLARSKLRPDLAIVGEPTLCKVVTAHKGVLWLELWTHGKAAHGARPELGRNAIHEMAMIVDLLEGSYAAQLNSKKHPLLGRATVNVGAIRGGKQPNIVPDECSAMLDRRMLPGETDARVLRQLKTLFRKNGLSAVIHRLHPFPCAPLETSSDLELVQSFLQNVRQDKADGVDYFSDAGVLSSAGIPSVLFGPGDIAQAHTPDEWISLRQLDRAKDVLLRFLRSLP